MIRDSHRKYTALSPSEIRSYWDCGFLHLKQVFGFDDVCEMQAECDRLMVAYGQSTEANLRAQTRKSAAGDSILDRFDPVIDISPTLARMVADKRLVQSIAQVFGEGVYLFKDKLIYKRPGTHGYEVHQDYQYWHELGCPPEAILSALVAIDSSSAETGALEVFPELHHELLGTRDRPQNIFDPTQGLVDKHWLEGKAPNLVQLDAGDVLLFHSLTPHRSGVNRGNHARRSLFLTYSAGQYGDLYQSYYRKYHEYLRKDRQKSGGQVYFH